MTSQGTGRRENVEDARTDYIRRTDSNGNSWALYIDHEGELAVDAL